ncbi:MAG: serine/threonine-protein phosphatase [Zoogloea sp.]|nr:serine/threonine-protein phosphatase [Zoogloea sp.]MCA0186844.1 protein phosphatase 2C domain-containing protein [Pseudomonadota bacterium]
MASHTGQVRLRNEDRVACSADRGLAVLADGMGGHAGGAEAALIAVAAWMEWMERGGPAAFPQEEDLREAIWLANGRVRNAAAEDPGLRGMGTTLVGACFRSDGYLLHAHVGDSRLYQLRRGCLRCLTRDHSVLRAQWDAGMIDAVSPGTALLRGLLTRAVGVDEHVEPDLAVMHLEPEDIYLLCSDGLTDMVPDVDIAEVLATLGVNPPLAAEHLIDLANDRGGMDNVSVIVISSCSATRLGTELG